MVDKPRPNTPKEQRKISRSWGKASLNRRTFHRQNGRCCYCKKFMKIPKSTDVMKGNLATREHIKPTSQGGKNEPHNISIACSDCNRKRGDKNWLMYLSEMRGEWDPKNPFDFSKAF